MTEPLSQSQQGRLAGLRGAGGSSGFGLCTNGPGFKSGSATFWGSTITHILQPFQSSFLIGQWTRTPPAAWGAVRGEEMLTASAKCRVGLSHRKRRVTVSGNNNDNVLLFLNELPVTRMRMYYSQRRRPEALELCHGSC